MQCAKSDTHKKQTCVHNVRDVQNESLMKRMDHNFYRGEKGELTYAQFHLKKRQHLLVDLSRGYRGLGSMHSE